MIAFGKDSDLPPRKRPGRNPVAARFAENMHRCRTRAGLSQEEVGYRSSLHRTEISLLECASRVPRIDTVVKIAGALEVEPGALLEGISWNAGHVIFGEFRLGGEEESRD